MSAELASTSHKTNDDELQNDEENLMAMPSSTNDVNNKKTRKRKKRFIFNNLNWFKILLLKVLKQAYPNSRRKQRNYNSVKKKG